MMSAKSSGKHKVPNAASSAVHNVPLYWRVTTLCVPSRSNQNTPMILICVCVFLGKRWLRFVAWHTGIYYLWHSWRQHDNSKQKTDENIEWHGMPYAVVVTTTTFIFHQLNQIINTNNSPRGRINENSSGNNIDKYQRRIPNNAHETHTNKHACTHRNGERRIVEGRKRRMNQ